MPQSIIPPVSAVHADGRVVELDVRDDLRNGREPFDRIMAAVESLEPADVLHLRATFEPVPLFRVMAKRGFSHLARQEGPDDWSVWFRRPAAAGAIAAGAAAVPLPPDGSRPSSALSVPAATPAAAALELDVRGLEPPEPMVRALVALEALPPGGVLVQHNSRVPQILLPILEERGFHYAVDASVPDDVVVRIRRAT